MNSSCLLLEVQELRFHYMLKRSRCLALDSINFFVRLPIATAVVFLSSAAITGATGASDAASLRTLQSRDTEQADMHLRSFLSSALACPPTARETYMNGLKEIVSWSTRPRNSGEVQLDSLELVAAKVLGSWAITDAPTSTPIESYGRAEVEAWQAWAVAR
jgi:hypothetical protein